MSDKQELRRAEEVEKSSENVQDVPDQKTPPKCPSCGQDVRDTSKFCDNCGTPLASTSVQMSEADIDSDASKEAAAIEQSQAPSNGAKPQPPVTEGTPPQQGTAQDPGQVNAAAPGVAQSGGASAQSVASPVFRKPSFWIAIAAACFVVVGGVVMTATGLLGLGGREAVWLPTKSVSYYSDGSVLSTTETTYDEHGNALSTRHYMPATKYTEASTSEGTHKSSDYDSDGYIKMYRNVNGETSEVTNVVRDRKLLSSTTKTKEGKETITEHEYHSNGYKKSSEADTFQLEWNTDGCLVHRVYKGDYPSESTYSWAMNDDGTPKSCTETRTSPSSSAYSSKKTDIETHKYSFQCDSNGCITKIYEDGALSKTIEYQKIEHPNEYAWTEAHCIETY